MMRRLLILIAVIAIPLSLIAGPVVQAASAHVSSPADAKASQKTVIVPATQPWTDTGISLPVGTVSFKASGTINVQSGNPAFNNTPAGQGPADPGCIGNSDTPWGDDWTAEGLPCWSLIGRLGNGSPFEIGDGGTFRVLRPGVLYLGVNDQADAFGDNSGSWTVQATWTSPPSTYTGYACMVDAPRGAEIGEGFGPFGHVGWAFQLPDGTWEFGANEGPLHKGQPIDLSGSRTWYKTGTYDYMDAIFKNALGSLKAGQHYYHNAGFYTDIACKDVTTNTAKVMAAENLVKKQQDEKYVLVLEDCLTDAVAVLNAYGVGGLPNQYLEPQPNVYYTDLVAAHGFTPSPL